jgi:phosphoglycerate dehydrogenase-like enzyme
MRVALLEPLGISSQMVEELARPIVGAGHEFVSYDQRTTDVTELARRSSGADVVMIANTPYSADVISTADTLKMIAVAFTGIDHVGLDACRERGITVCNCAGYSDTSVAELTLGLAIDVLRKVVPADSAARTGGTSAGLTGSEICGKTVGVVGTGHIGTQVGRLFCAFGARVLGYARHENPEATRVGIEFVPNLDDLLAQSDIVTLHVPSNAGTRGMIDARRLALMPRGSILINCARGAVVDNEALARALDQGHLAGAGVDVFDTEPPLPTDYPLAHAKNAVLTPHVGFLTQEAMQRRARIEFDNVTSWLAGEPRNVCTL